MKLEQIPLSAALLIISLQISAQDLIYKKNGEIVNARILNESGKSIFGAPDWGSIIIFFHPEHSV